MQWRVQRNNITGDSAKGDLKALRLKADNTELFIQGMTGIVSNPLLPYICSPWVVLVQDGHVY